MLAYLFIGFVYLFIYRFDFYRYNDSARYTALLYTIITSISSLFDSIYINRTQRKWYLEIFLCMRLNKDRNESTITRISEIYNEHNDSFLIFNYYDKQLGL